MSSHRATSSASPSGGRDPALRPPPPGQSHYQLLELTPAATVPELRQAFRSLSKRYHPDTTTLPAAEAREAFARLRQAYAVLADPTSRRAYDAMLRAAATAPLLGVPPLPSGPAAAPKPVGVRRSLSGGEWFALVLLALALALSLVLGVGLAWARGAALVTRPSWWPEGPADPGAITVSAATDDGAAGAPSGPAAAAPAAAPAAEERDVAAGEAASVPAVPAAPMTGVPGPVAPVTGAPVPPLVAPPLAAVPVPESVSRDSQAPAGIGQAR